MINILHVCCTVFVFASIHLTIHGMDKKSVKRSPDIESENYDFYQYAKINGKTALVSTSLIQEYRDISKRLNGEHDGNNETIKREYISALEDYKPSPHECYELYLFYKDVLPAKYNSLERDLCAALKPTATKFETALILYKLGIYHQLSGGDEISIAKLYLQVSAKVGGNDSIVGKEAENQLTKLTNHKANTKKYLKKY